MTGFNRITLVLILAWLSGCGTQQADQFQQELELSLRAGRDELSAEEKARLLADNHPLLIQLGEPSYRALLELFAELPDATRHELFAKKYVKWDFSQLDESRQQVFRSVVSKNRAIAELQGLDLPEPDWYLDVLLRSDVGFAVVELPDTRDRVVSCFVLWPEHATPAWVTVVNSGSSGIGTQEYFKAHELRLRSLKIMSDSDLPASPVKTARKLIREEEKHQESQMPHSINSNNNAEMGVNPSLPLRVSIRETRGMSDRGRRA